MAWIPSNNVIEQDSHGVESGFSDHEPENRLPVTRKDKAETIIEMMMEEERETMEKRRDDKRRETFMIVMCNKRERRERLMMMIKYRWQQCSSVIIISSSSSWIRWSSISWAKVAWYWGDSEVSAGWPCCDSGACTDWKRYRELKVILLACTQVH